MMPSVKYSFAFCPPPETVAAVKLMKHALSEKIGWFNSKNSEAHITINVFEAGAKDLEKAKEYAMRFVGRAASFEVRFEGVGTFSNGAFFLSPDADSKKHLEHLMIHYNKDFPSNAEKSNTPHLSIARRLDARQIAVALEIFKDFKGIGFLCDRISLRKFDSGKKQYYIESEYIFQNLPDSHFEESQF